MHFRDATFSDVSAIAHLHAESWRSAYRGILSDHYLDQQVQVERLALWQKRFAPAARTGSKELFVILAEDAGRLVGFSCVFPEHDATYGSFLDNLHVAPGFTRTGIGSELLRFSMQRLRDGGSASGLYLWVLEKNLPARRFYQRHGAIEITPAVAFLMPDGQTLPEIRCHWPKLA